MKSLGTLWAVLADELGKRCAVSTTLDINTVKRRSKSEGASFLTITLPKLGSDLDRSLADGQIAPTAFAGFRRRGGLPLFLGGFLEQIFDHSTGVLLDNPSLDCILAVRQLCRLAAKVELECADRRIRAAYQGYVQTEDDLRVAQSNWTESDLRPLARVFELLFHRVLVDAERLIKDGQLEPKHGPGATADRLVGNEKFDMTYWTWRLESVFSSADYLAPNHRFAGWVDARLEIVDPEHELPVRVIHVPKTLKTPRIIAIEPTAMQYMQQALMAVLVDGVDQDEILRNFITFRDQTPNQCLAGIGSVTGDLATLDLSEASDRVSNQLVKRLLCRYGLLSKAVQATRSLRAEVPGHGVIPLVKFASMGSGLTFPIETMVFLAVVLTGVERDLEHQLEGIDVIRLMSQVHVFGDDIIVPAQHADSVVSALELYGFKVNHSKSFWTGKFRESCGKDYFQGHDVSVVKLRKELPTRRADVENIVSAVSFRNQLADAGLFETARWIDRRISQLLPLYPVGDPRCGALVRTPLPGDMVEFEAMHKDLHTPVVKAYVVVPKKREIPLDGVGALHKTLSKRGAEPFEDRDHLSYSGRPLAVSIKPRWINPVYAGSSAMS